MLMALPTHRKKHQDSIVSLFWKWKWSHSVPSDSLWPRGLAPQSTEFSRQEYWSGLPFPCPGDLPDPGIEPGSPALQADALPSESPGKLVSVLGLVLFLLFSQCLLCSLLSHITVCHQIILYCFMYKNLRAVHFHSACHCCHAFSTYIMNLQILQFYFYFIQSIIFFTSQLPF